MTACLGDAVCSDDREETDADDELEPLDGPDIIVMEVMQYIKVKDDPVIPQIHIRDAGLQGG